MHRYKFFVALSFFYSLCVAEAEPTLFTQPSYWQDPGLSNWTVQLNLSANFLWNTYPDAPYKTGGFSLGGALKCQNGSWFCSHYQPEINFQAEIYPTAPTQFSEARLGGPSILVSPHLRLGAGEITFFHDAYSSLQIGEDSNVSIRLASVLWEFAKVRHPHWQGSCTLMGSGLGAKFINYYQGNSTPFYGLDVLALRQGCFIMGGTAHIQGWARYQFSLAVQVGESGDGTVNNWGAFGALNTEAELGVEFGLNIPLADKWTKSKISAVQIAVPYRISEHLNRGCIASGVSLYACGDNSSATYSRFEVQLRILFGF